MNYNANRLKSQLKRHEGLELNAYKDSEGILTIGYGRNLEGLSITQKQADEWLKEDIKTAEIDLVRAYPFVENLSEKRQRVLLNMTFNLGITRLMGFKKMWKALEKGNWYIAADEMISSKWYEQVGYRAEELVAMMRTG